MIVYQDFKFRAISWWSIPLLASLLLFQKQANSTWSETSIYTLFNVGIIVFQFLVISLYFSIKQKQIINIFKKYIGIGDLLFLIAIAPFFDPMQFVFFEVFSLIAILIASLGYGFVKKSWSFKIPLAGMQAICFILYTLYTKIYN